jgi:hypothetical protein
MIAFSEILTDIFDTDSYCEYPKILTNNKNSIIVLFFFNDFMTSYQKIFF